MITFRQALTALCLATSLGGLAAYAAMSDATPADPTGAYPGYHKHCRRGLGEMAFVLHKLNLTAEQKAQIKAIFAGEKSQWQALRASSEANLRTLASTPPTDSNYAALIKAAQSDAATRITQKSQVWSEIYQHVLTQAQQQEIPGIVAAQAARRQAKQAP